MKLSDKMKNLGFENIVDYIEYDYMDGEILFNII